MSEIVLDFGNSWGKWYLPRSGGFGDFMHAIAPLTESDWWNIVGRGGKPRPGYVRVNGNGYAIGMAARRHIISERPRGAARYREDYYGVALAYALSEAFQESKRNITLYASYAPGDVSYGKHLVAAARRKWTVECQYGTLAFDVKSVMTFDEPLGGLSHFTLTKDGLERRKNPLADKTTLVIDVGGHTTDAVAIDPGGMVDISSLRSTRTGIISLTQQFERDLRANNTHLFQETNDIDLRRLEAAILSGKFKYGNSPIDCQQEAADAIRALTNDVIQVINAAGGAANYDVVLMTGGGSMVIYEALCQAMVRIDFLLAETNTEFMKYANVFGGAKLFKMLEVMGMLS